jgi:hypothetical protein
VQARVTDYHRFLTPKEFTDIQENIRLLKEKKTTAKKQAPDWTDADETQLAALQSKLVDRPHRQVPLAVAETLTLEVTLPANTPAGLHELRLKTPAGLSNPCAFQVGNLPEFIEPIAERPRADIPGNDTMNTLAVDLPVLLNGRIMPAEIDRFRFASRRGQRLVFAVSARALIPYLADAVPGWFHATLGLYDATGRELAYVDDFNFEPDPVLSCEIPADGDYTLVIQDALHRGREDFVYRTWEAMWGIDAALATLPFAQSTGPEATELEPNDTHDQARTMNLPVTINGKIQNPGDRDVFRFEGRGGNTIVIETTARRLRSPLDSVLLLTDADGRKIGLNDDHEDKSAGLITHQTDSFIQVTLPADGVYFLTLQDTQQRGGNDFSYRLRVGPPKPDFAVLTTPSTFNLRAGASLPITAHVIRHDGFDGEINLTLADAPPGFTLSGGRLPPGRTRTVLTLNAPAGAKPITTNLTLVATAHVGDRQLTHRVQPADDRMQAFLPRHLVPAKMLMTDVAGGPRWKTPPVILAENPLKIPIGGTTRFSRTNAQPQRRTLHPF